METTGIYGISVTNNIVHCNWCNGYVFSHKGSLGYMLYFLVNQVSPHTIVETNLNLKPFKRLTSLKYVFLYAPAKARISCQIE